MHTAAIGLSHKRADLLLCVWIKIVQLNIDCAIVID